MKVFATECSEPTKESIKRTWDSIHPRVLPADWKAAKDAFWNSRWYKSTDGLRVALEVECQQHEGREELWLHLSVSRTDRDPTYFDMKRVKHLFIGSERKAIQVFPPEAEHYNHHPHCLHLFAPLDGDPLPDFRHESGAL